MLNKLYPISRQLMAMNQQNYERYFLSHSDLTHRLNIVLGQRGIGKSTACCQFILKQADIDSDKILYVPVDHFACRQYELYDIAENFYQYGGEYLFFDEIHKDPDWSIALKSIYDTFPELNVIASGSAALEIAKGTHDLSRRAIIYHMKGMSLREFIELKCSINLPSFTLVEILQHHEKITREIIEKLKGINQKILACFKSYLQIGYYPYFNEFQSKNLFYKTLEQNLHITVESDLASIYPELSGSSIRKIKQLLSIIAANVPFTLNMNRLKELIGIGDVRTLKTYLTYLEDAGLIMLLNKGKFGVKNLEKPDKIYLNNTSQLYALSPISTVNNGTVREIFFTSMLRHIHQLTSSENGDFIIDDKYTFEIGGRKKSFEQIKDLSEAYLICDDIEMGFKNKIPLWLFGFLY